MLSRFRSELRWALRFTRRRPAFACAVVLTLGAAIGAATTAFGLAEATIWRALPFADEDRLVFVWEETSRDGVPAASRVTGARYAAWRDVKGALASTALFGAAGFTVESATGGQAIRGVRVSAGYFDALGIRPALGRGFLSEEESPGRERVVVLSHGLWQRHLGGRADVVGRSLRLSGEPYTVIGVMPPVTMPAWPSNPATVSLDPDAAEFWVPIPRSAALDSASRAHVFGVVARLAPGVSRAEAEARLRQTAGPSLPDPHGARIVPFRDQLIADSRAVLFVLAAATLMVWLIACANLAALFVSSFESRRGELAVRAALGGSLWRLVRQLALEASLLISAGAGVGLFVANEVLSRVPGWLPASTPFLTTPRITPAVALFAAGLALASLVVLSSWPILRLMAGSTAPRGTVARPRSVIYRTLVVAQVAVTVALAVAAGLLARSLATVTSQEPGFNVRRVLAADLGLPADADWRRLGIAESNVLEAVTALPQVAAAAVAYDNPFEANWSEAPTIVGDSGDESQVQVELRIVSPGYFDALGVEVLDGRTFTDTDTVLTAGWAVVNEAFARQVGGRLVGRRLKTSTPRNTYAEAPDEFEIVGVVENERMRGLEEPARPAYYLSTRQFPQPSLVLLARTSAEPMTALPDVRTAIHRAESSTTVSRPTSLEAVQAAQLASRRLTTEVVSGFGLAAIALAAAGLYGLLTVLVSSRTRELGVRLAVGATPASLVRLVVAESLRNAAFGALAGIVLALLTGRLLENLLVDVSPRDPLTIAVVVSVLLAVSALAAILPARRAAGVDPAAALKAEL
jgi:predicted permease